MEGEEVKKKDLVNNIMHAWDNVVESSPEQSYIDAVMHFREVCKTFPKFLIYVESTILDVVKEKIVRAWTDKVLHLGNRTTNRVESAHGVLKNFLTNGVGDLATCWQAVHNMVLLQHVEIQATFRKSVK